jgi:hypothetical protein
MEAASGRPAHLAREEKLEVDRIREALLPLGYYVYGVSRDALGSGHIRINARVPEDSKDWERLYELERRAASLSQQQV